MLINPYPTEAQKIAGNYKKEHIRVQGLDISIENKKGSVRSGVDERGHKWSCVLPADYGYIRGTEGADFDHVDCYLGPDLDSHIVFIINQLDHKTGRFDEHKCMIGFRNEREAVETYCRAFSDGCGHKRIGSTEPISMDGFKHWLRSGKTKKHVSTSEIMSKALNLAAHAKMSSR